MAIKTTDIAQTYTQETPSKYHFILPVRDLHGDLGPEFPEEINRSKTGNEGSERYGYYE